MGAMATTPTQPTLREAIERTGYYPDVVQDVLDNALSNEAVRDFIVQHETTFDRADEIRRHITVLLLTAGRLLVVHVDEHSDAEQGGGMQATSTTESVPLSLIGPVVVQRVVDNPAHFRPGDLPTEVVLTVNWGSISRIDLEPATCGDPQCEADHGYTGALAMDDWSLRVSRAADGDDVVQAALRFSTSLIAATSG
ncbi:MAG TPA: DUF5998 family protein [Actinomycetota bacterium]|nr:DUF5998 family protein [Actinomycetota bacterium]